MCRWIRTIPVRGASTVLSFLAVLTASSQLRAQVNDRAGIFSPGAVERAEAVLGQIQSRHGRRLLVETYPEIPAERKWELWDKSKDQLFRDWAVERGRSEHVRGVVVLIVMRPGRVQVESGRDTSLRVFTPQDVAGLHPQLAQRLGDRRYDEALRLATEYVLARMDANEPPADLPTLPAVQAPAPDPSPLPPSSPPPMPRDEPRPVSPPATPVPDPEPLPLRAKEPAGRAQLPRPPSPEPAPQPRPDPGDRQNAGATTPPKPAAPFSGDTPPAAQGNPQAGAAAADSASPAVIAASAAATVMLQLLLVAWVAKDAKSRGSGRVPAWVLLVLVSGPLGGMIYALAR